MNVAALAEAAEHLRDAGVVLHATEGVWGLACDPFSQRAVTRVLKLKQRPASKGLIVIGAGEADFAPELAPLSLAQRQLVSGSWPGAVTWLLPNVRFASWITGDSDKVAVRVPGHPQARALCAAYGGPLVSTSANPAGEPAALTETQARAYFPAGVDYLLSGEVLQPGQPSSIRELSGEWLRGAG